MPFTLFDEHTDILEAAEKFLAAVRAQPRPSMDQVSRERVRLSALIRQHRLTEEEQIFMPLRAGGRLEHRTELQPLVARLLAEKVKYSEHIRRWSPKAIEEDWSGYVRAVEERVGSLRMVIREEERALYTVVLDLSPAQMAQIAQRQ